MKGAENICPFYAQICRWIQETVQKYKYTQKLKVPRTGPWPLQNGFSMRNQAELSRLLLVAEE